MKEFLKYMWFMIDSVLWLFFLIFLQNIGIFFVTQDIVEDYFDGKNVHTWADVPAFYSIYWTQIVICCSEIKTQSMLYKRQISPKKKKV